MVTVCPLQSQAPCRRKALSGFGSVALQGMHGAQAGGAGTPTYTRNPLARRKGYPPWPTGRVAQGSSKRTPTYPSSVRPILTIQCNVPKSCAGAVSRAARCAGCDDSGWLEDGNVRFVI